MEIVTALQPLVFAGNIPDVEFVEVPPFGAYVQLFDNSRPESPIIDEIYAPDATEKVLINLKSILTEIINTDLPVQDAFISTLTVPVFTLKTPDDSYTFSVLPGGIDSGEDIFNFLRHNFLTWQQRDRIVVLDSKLFLSYFAQEDCLLKIEVTFADGSNSSMVTAIADNDFKSFNVSPAFLSGLFKNDIKAFVVWIESYAGYALTDKIHYEIDVLENSNTFLFLNSLGGFDTITFTGNSSKKVKTETEISYLRTKSTEGKIALTKIYKQNTGYLTEDLSEIVSDFLLSKKRWLISGDKLIPIIIEDSDNEFIFTELNSFEFEYRLSEQSSYIHLSHKENLNPDQLPPFWNNVSACFDQKKGNRIIDRKNGLVATLLANNLSITFPNCYSDALNKQNRAFWLSDIPGNSRTWNVSELTGMYTINYATRICTESLFFRDVDENRITSVLPIIIYATPLNEDQTEAVLEYLKEYYFLEDDEDGALLIDNIPEADNNTYLIDNTKK